MKLLNGRLNGENLPSTLPDSVAKEVISVSNSIQSKTSPTSPTPTNFGNSTSNFSNGINNNSVWTLTNEEKMKYYEIFKQYDSFNSGYLTSNLFLYGIIIFFYCFSNFIYFFELFYLYFIILKFY